MHSTHAHTDTHRHTHSDTHTCTHMHTHTCTHTHTHMHTHTHTHTHLVNKVGSDKKNTEQSSHVGCCLPFDPHGHGDLVEHQTSHSPAPTLSLRRGRQHWCSQDHTIVLVIPVEGKKQTQEVNEINCSIKLFCKTLLLLLLGLGLKSTHQRHTLRLNFKLFLTSKRFNYRTKMPTINVIFIYPVTVLLCS